MEDINQGILLYKSTPNAVLIDLRDAEDYAEGHIPGAVITGHDSPVFCVSGFDSIVKPCGLWYNDEEICRRQIIRPAGPRMRARLASRYEDEEICRRQIVRPAGSRMRARLASGNNNEATGAKRGWPSCRLPKGKAAGVMV